MFDLDLLKSKLDIVEIINTVVPLKKYGPSYKGCCPFHSEKTPSFNVNPMKQLFHCFGCHKGGDVFEFIMILKGISFKETIAVLAKEAGITLEPTLFKRKLFPQQELPAIIIDNYPVILLLLQEKAKQIEKIKKYFIKQFDGIKQRYATFLYQFSYNYLLSHEADKKVELYESKLYDKIADWNSLMIEVELLLCFIEDNIDVFNEIVQRKAQENKASTYQKVHDLSVIIT
jgi:hypothetical protein